MDDEIIIKKRNIFCCFTNCCLWKNLKKMTQAEHNRFSWNSFGYKSRTIALPPIFEILIDLYDGKDVIAGLESSRINPDFTPGSHIRNDLEYYIPQLTNFMIFHQDIFCQKLKSFLEEASLTDPYFAHSYYWHILSLVPAVDKEKARTILGSIALRCSEAYQTQLFVNEYAQFLLALHNKLSPDEYEAERLEIQSRKAQADKIIRSYKEDDFNLKVTDFEISGLDLELKPYIPTDPQTNNDESISNPFTATLIFFNDLSIVGEEAGKASARMQYLHSALRHLNKSLPSCIYVPFVKDAIRHYAVLNIVVEETKIFPTKTRAPFYICLELYRPQEELAHEYTDLFHPDLKKEKKENILAWARKNLYLDKLLTLGQEEGESQEIDPKFDLKRIQMVSSPRILRNIKHLGEASFLDVNQTQTDSFYRSNTTEVPDQEGFENSEQIPFPETRARNLSADKFTGFRIIDLEDGSSSIFGHRDKKKKVTNSSPEPKHPVILDNSLMKPDHLNFYGDLNETLLEQDEKETMGDDGLSCSLSHEEIVDIFGEDSLDQQERIKRNSPFKHLKTWRLVHMIVKKGADMKEEQFAAQLISQFDQIFKAEGLKLILTPYEIVSLGNDFGVVEMIKDAITISRLKEKMYNLGITTLSEFFIKYYGNQVERARKRFCRSLAAYSILCYFLQIKDRHNGNIMFHKQGHILHIDFGFFFSNSPGKGLEFERRVPFKLLNEYIEVLGGPRSGLFQEFRKLFYQGFMAVRKHREEILILVKMMYSSQGKNLPCFKTGIKSITELEQRFCPPGVHEDDLKEYCYNLINQSLDNWRAKCYDKYQYHVQGIFY